MATREITARETVPVTARSSLRYSACSSTDSQPLKQKVAWERNPSGRSLPATPEIRQLMEYTGVASAPQMMIDTSGQPGAATVFYIAG